MCVISDLKMTNYARMSVANFDNITVGWSVNQLEEAIVELDGRYMRYQKVVRVEQDEGRDMSDNYMVGLEIGAERTALRRIIQQRETSDENKNREYVEDMERVRGTTRMEVKEMRKAVHEYRRSRGPVKECHRFLFKETRK
jgi:hypothetical protein